MKLNFIFCIGEIIILLLLNPIMNIWLGENITFVPSYYVGAIFALYGCLLVTNSVLSTFANGLSELKVQFVCFLFGAILKVPLSIFLVKLLNSWTGVIFSNVICMGIYTIVEPFFIKRYLKKI